MSARRINGWWWVDFRFDYRRYRVRCPSNRRSDALTYESVLISRLMRGEPLHGAPPPPPSPKFADIAARWMASYGGSRRAARQAQYRATLGNELIPFFGKMRIDASGTEAVERFKTKLVGAKLSPLTINDKLCMLRVILTSAVEAGELEQLPKIKRLKASRSPYDVLTEEEVAKLLSDRSERVAAELACMAYYTGMRIGELLALDWKDVDMASRQLVVRHSVSGGVLGPTKSYQERPIPLHDAAMAMLESLPSREGRVFVDWKGRPLTYATAVCRLQKPCERVGLRQVRWHALRHTFASTLAMRNVPVNAIQGLLGHESVMTTMRYAHTNQFSLAEAVAKLNQSMASELNDSGNSTTR